MESTLDVKAELWEILSAHPHLFMSREQADDWVGAGTTGLLRRGESFDLCHYGRRKVHGCLQILTNKRKVMRPLLLQQEEGPWLSPDPYGIPTRDKTQGKRSYQSILMCACDDKQHHGQTHRHKHKEGRHEVNDRCVVTNAQPTSQSPAGTQAVPKWQV